MKKSNHVVEHTPIYDVDAHLRQQQKIKRRKAVIDCTIFLCSIVFTFSFLFIGE